MSVRLRQVALVASRLQPLVDDLVAELGVEAEPFRDPGVRVFGLENAVLALGDTFLEVVSPVQPDTTAGRYLERRGGDGGYMAIFQVDDLEAARARVERLGIRVVWRSDHEDIAGTHLHPKDVPGALVSIDWADPPGSWRWAGPDWTKTVPEHPGGGIVGITVQTANPHALAARWAEVLGLDVVVDGEGARVPLTGAEASFVPIADARGEGICALEIVVPSASARTLSLGGTQVRVRPAAA
jgi:hypothetical protein